MKIKMANVYIRFFTLVVLGLSLLVILSHFALFQVKYPAEIGRVTADIIVLGIIVIMLFETHHLSRTWEHPFIWINLGILLFFVGSLFELLGEFFIKPGFIKYLVESGSRIFAFGVLAWGFFQWGKEKIEASRKEEKMKKIDGLTGLPDRPSFHHELERFERMAKRYGDFFSLIYLNIDNFKSYNEEKGVTSGDAVLKKLASLLTKNLRTGDLVFRFGGDEFMILIPMVREELATRIAHRIRAMVENELKSDGITVSVAVATYQEGQDILKKLEEAMQKAKKEGKNRVCLAK